MINRLDEIMFHLASERAPVQLTDGRTARLVCWKPTRRHRRENHRMRLLFPSGRLATVAIRHLAGILDDDGMLFPLPKTPEAGDGDTDGAFVHLVGGSERSGRDVPDAGLLAADGRGDGGGLDAGQRPPPPVQQRGSAGADRGGRAVPVRTGHPVGDVVRGTVGGGEKGVGV